MNSVIALVSGVLLLVLAFFGRGFSSRKRIKDNLLLRQLLIEYSGGQEGNKTAEILLKKCEKELSRDLDRGAGIEIAEIVLIVVLLIIFLASLFAAILGIKLL